VGVAFSGYAGSADNIGYIIPYPVINSFLRQYVSDPKVSRVCDYGLGYMLCENPSLQKKHKMVILTWALILATFHGDLAPCRPHRVMFFSVAKLLSHADWCLQPYVSLPDIHLYM